MVRRILEFITFYQNSLHLTILALRCSGRFARRSVCDILMTQINVYIIKPVVRSRVPNINLSNFMCLLVDFGIPLCSSTNELKQNSNTSSREDYIPQIPQILTVLLEIPWHVHTECIAVLFTRMHCVTNNSNKNTRKFGGWEHSLFAAQTQSFFVSNFLQQG